jgi:nucleoside-diphosphate-sugar epimerase
VHTILGANGTIARELSRAIATTNTNIRQVSRNPKKVHLTDEVFAADLLDVSATDMAVAGSEVVYLVVGLKYETSTWQTQWPVVMRNVIDACKRHHARLIYFDNVYAYGKVVGTMTEETPFNPCSKKGEVRAKVATMLLDEMQRGNIAAMIARAADFYGPSATQSFPYSTVFSRLKLGKTPQWIGNPNAIHTFTYTPDAGDALALLARSPEAYGQTWHLPTSSELLTGANFVRLACAAADHPNKLQLAPSWLLSVMGLFTPVLRENAEMMYQFEADYRFDSAKIESVYSLLATPYNQGVSACLRR